MPVDRQAKLIFVHIPKTAGTSIELALNLHGDWRRENLHSLFGQIKSHALLRQNLTSNFLQHLNLHEIQALMGDEFADYEIFTVVRDPWTRFLSSFRRKDPDLCSYVRWRTAYELDDLSLFEYFNIACWVCHPHLNSQASFFQAAADGSSVRDVLKNVRVFRFEELSVLEDWLSDKYQKSVKLGWHQNPVSAIPRIADDDLADLRYKVCKFYDCDCSLFRYKKI